jgi:hypothetical protein
MHTGSVSPVSTRNDRALFLSPLLAAAIVFAVRVVVVSKTGQAPSFLTSVFWAAVESASYSAIWLPVGWLLAGAAWCLRLHKASRRLLSAALIATLISLATVCAGITPLPVIATPREGATIIIGLAANLATFLCLQNEP